MRPEEIAARIADPAAPSRALPVNAAAVAGLDPGRVAAAAVLVPIILHPDPTVLLTLREPEILAANAADVAAAEGKIEDALMQRLRLKPGKIRQLAEGVRAIAAQVGAPGGGYVCVV